MGKGLHVGSAVFKGFRRPGVLILAAIAIRLPFA
jgi:hypothetical protein